MGAYNDYIETIKAPLAGIIPIGGTFVPTSDEFSIGLAQQVKGGTFPVPSLEVMADIPFQLLESGMSIIVQEHERPDGTIHPRSRYYLAIMPEDGKRISEIPGALLFTYWKVEKLDNANNNADITSQYAPNFEGKRPKFLISEITNAAYQAGYPTTDSFDGGNPSDIIWKDDYDPTQNHAWVRQRIGTQAWGIPIALNGSADYEQNQYIDVIFKWVPKGDPSPGRPVQPINYTELPATWLATPGDDFSTRIATEDLYRSQVLKNPYGVPKGDWDVPILISSNALLVRYGNTPGNSDFLNDTFWRGYYTPGLDTFMATRTSGVSTDWTITKIDQESGEFDDFVFLELPMIADSSDIIAATPTNPVPIGGEFPNNCKDAPFEAQPNYVLYMSKATKYSDGSFKKPWSLPKRFDGLDTIQAIIEETPGNVFYKYRDVSGNLVDAFSVMTLVPRLYKASTELTADISEYKWYRGATLIVFDATTKKALNLGVGLNPYHEIGNDGELKLNPEAVDASQQYTVGIQHASSIAPYEASIQVRDATDDGSAMLADIFPVNGSTFKNATGLYRFNAQFFKGGIADNSGVVFTWTIKDAVGAAISGGLRNSGGTSVGDTNYAAAIVYVQGSDIDQYATLELTGTYGQVVRTDKITLTDVSDGEGLEVLYWGTGSTDPGSPTDFTPRTKTKAEVLALAIGYLEDATGTWYMIQRIGGVWGGEIQLRSESARPNGGIVVQIYKNIESGVDPVPVSPSVPGSGSIIPAGWTLTPTAFTGGEDATYVTSCPFLLRTDVTADPAVLTRDNYTPYSTYGTPKLFSAIAVPPAVAGENGWSPVLGIESDGERRVMKLVDWTGGTGTKPSGSGGTNSYIGVSGLTTIGAAVDIRGAQGNAGSSSAALQSVVNLGFSPTPTGVNKDPYGLASASGYSTDFVLDNPKNLLLLSRWNTREYFGGSISGQYVVSVRVQFQRFNSPSGTWFNDVFFDSDQLVSEGVGFYHAAQPAAKSTDYITLPAGTWRFRAELYGFGSFEIRDAIINLLTA